MENQNLQTFKLSEIEKMFSQDEWKYGDMQPLVGSIQIEIVQPTNLPVGDSKEFFVSIPNKKICPLCKRELAGIITRHHLVPVLKGGKRGESVKLHRICHDKIHSLFSERELQVSFNTIEKLLTNDKVINFVNWVQNKPIDFYDSSKKVKHV